MTSDPLRSRRQHRLVTALAIAAVAGTLAGCGQMGPLYQPPEQTPDERGAARPADNPAAGSV